MAEYLSEEDMNTGEYISRDDVLKAMQYRCKTCDNGNGVMCRACDTADAMDIICDTPAADVQPAPQWISVKERLPEIGRSVLIYYPKWDGDEIQVAKLEDDRMMFDICGEFDIGTGVVTHWMPLPEPPNE